MNATEYQTHLAAIQAGNASRQELLGRIRVIWRTAREVFESFPHKDQYGFDDYLRSHYENSIFNSIYYRDGVTGFSIHGEQITLTVSQTYSCETNSDDFVIPTSWLYTDNVQELIRAECDRLYSTFVAKQVEGEREQEEQRRAQYEALKKEFET